MSKLVRLWRENRGLCEFVGLVILWPVAAVLLIYGEWSTTGCYDCGLQLRSDYHTHAVILAISGMIAFVWRNH
jgi:hypothetical protein